MISRNMKASIDRLKMNNDFKEVVKWLKESFVDQQDVNIDLTGEQAIRGQGKAEVLRDITTVLGGEE
jgi:hypothetical protein